MYFNKSQIGSSIVVIKINGIKPKDHELIELVFFITELINNGRGGIIVDISEAKFLNAEQRGIISNAIKEGYEAFEKNFHSLAYVNNSIIARVVLKGILALSSLPISYKVFLTTEDAVRWCRANEIKHSTLGVGS